MSRNLPAAVGRESREEVPALRGKIRPNGIDFPDDMTYDEWEHELRVLWWMYEWSPWALADALNFGANRWPDRYEQAVAITGRAIKTLYNKTWLARQFPRERGLRSKVLTPAHHEVLAGMDDDKKKHYIQEGERLDRESNGHLTVRAFKGYVEDQERNPDGEKVEVVDAPAKCSGCFGTGKCPHCHGSGEAPANGKGY